MVQLDQALLGWYEAGPRKSGAPAYTHALVQQALNLYDDLELGDTVAYYSSEVSVDGPWCVFIIGEDGRFESLPAPSEVVVPACFAQWLRLRRQRKPEVANHCHLQLPPSFPCPSALDPALALSTQGPEKRPSGDHLCRRSKGMLLFRLFLQAVWQTEGVLPLVFYSAVFLDWPVVACSN